MELRQSLELYALRGKSRISELLLEIEGSYDIIKIHKLAIELERIALDIKQDARLKIDKIAEINRPA